MYLNQCQVNYYFLYILKKHDSCLDTSKHGTRVTPETPLAVKAAPKAQWLLQRYIIIRKKNRIHFAFCLD